MITYSKETGCYFDTGDRHYHLLEMMDYKGKKTSDIIAIWDFDNNALVGYTYGASTIGIEELDEVVSEAVREHEAKQATAERTAPCIAYRFTKGGISAFSCDVVEDILEHDICEPYRISHGNRSIELPDLAQIHELLDVFLEDALEEAEN